MIYDQVFRYYEPQKTKSISQIPNFLQFQASASGREIVPLSQCKIVCSNRKIKIETTPDDNLTALVENGRSMTVVKGFVYIYKDDF